MEQCLDCNDCDCDQKCCAEQIKVEETLMKECVDCTDCDCAQACCAEQV